MSVRKRKWTTRSGVEKEAWVVDYVDRAGKRHIETFPTKGAARDREHEIAGEKKAGRHVARSESITVSEAGEKWIEQCEIDRLQPTTIKQCRQHLKLHITPYLGDTKLSDLTAPDIKKWQRDLAGAGVSEAMRGKVRTSLGWLLGQAMEDGNATQNVVRDTGRRKKSKKKKKRPEIGIDIPTVEEIRLLLNAVKGRFRPFFVTAVSTGMRASELRGLTWDDVDFDKGEIHVRKRADRYGNIDLPKSDAGQRTIPVIPLAINTLKEWKLECEPSDLDLVFPTSTGGIQDYSNIRRQMLIPLIVKAGIVDKDGKAKYTGLHAIRHFFASWCINRKADGGQGLPPKIVQERMGHATISQTMDTYGHLFPRGDDKEELREAELALLGT